MNIHIILFATRASLTAPVSHASEHTFTSKDGRSLNATILSKTPTIVRVRRETDQKLFSIPIASLMDRDQEFIRSWQPEPLQPLRIPKRYYRIAPPRVPQSNTTTSGGNGGCRLVRVETIVIPGTCPPRTPCPGR